MAPADLARPCRKAGGHARFEEAPAGGRADSSWRPSYFLPENRIELASDSDVIPSVSRGTLGRGRRHEAAVARHPHTRVPRETLGMMLAHSSGRAICTLGS